MNKAELIEVVATRIDTSKKEASEAVQAVVDAITEAVSKGQKVSISGFGVFEKAERAARTYRAPSTGEAIRKVATAVPRFRPGGDFKAFVSGDKEPEAPVAPPVPVTKPTAKSSAPAKKAPAAAKKAPAKKAPAKKAPAAAKKAPAKKAAAKKSPATPTKAATTTKKATPAKTAPATNAAAALTPPAAGDGPTSVQ
jgi:DNA-binding protein HU-beta